MGKAVRDLKKFVRYQDCDAIRYGELIGNTIQPLDRNFLDQDCEYCGERIALKSVCLLTPVTPPNIIAIGLNYKQHSEETKIPTANDPVIFLKATTSLAHPYEEIMLPAMAPKEVDYEGELAIVIGKTAKNITVEEAHQYIFGYTCANDVSARDCQFRLDKQWARGKSFDAFSPMGPCVVQGIDAGHLNIQTRLNGKIMQSGNTSQLIFGIEELVSYCSKNMTLLPGTVIMSGTPSGVGYTRRPPVFLKKGDVVEIEIEGIGVLHNAVTVE